MLTSRKLLGDYLEPLEWQGLSIKVLRRADLAARILHSADLELKPDNFEAVAFDSFVDIELSGENAN